MADYSSTSLADLKALCKERKIKGFSGKSKQEVIALLSPVAPAAAATPPQRQDVIHGDSLAILPTLDADSAQIILADPPYNIGKDFGNASDKQPMDEYLVWCETWIKECLRILKPNGTMFIYGFSEILALIMSKVPHAINRRWIIWHYTNKNVPSLHFWQRSHESILVLWKSDKVFHRDDIREAYTDGFLNGAAGKQRKATKGRFSKGEKTTTYTAHANGALPRDVIKLPALTGEAGRVEGAGVGQGCGCGLPRDVIKLPALAGGAGAAERVAHPTQKPLALCDKLLRSCRQDDGYVLVPFAGSGSECVAAKNLGLPFVGIELNAEYVKLIRQRLQPPQQADAAPPPSESQSVPPSHPSS